MLLVSQLAAIFIVALACFTLIDVVAAYWVPVPYNLAVMALSTLVWLLNRKGYFMAAKVLLTIAVNFITLFFTSILVKDLGIFIFSVSINIGVIAAYGYERIKTAVLIIVISTLLFLVAMFHPFARLPIPENDNYINQNLAFSFLIGNASAIMIIYYFLRANQKIQSMLAAKEADLSNKNEALVKVNAELDKFVYSASHDMRAPLTSIQGLIQLMEVSNDVTELKNYTSLLKGRADHLDQFIRKVSEYARIGRDEIRLEKVSIKKIIRESLENIRFYPNAEKIKIHVNISDKLEVASDALRLQIIFGNLISNAIKYHDYAKPEPFIRIDQQIAPDRVRIVIEDNGSGIKEESLKNIFNMFYRASHQAQGNGLGLFIVKEALEKVGGSIEVNSTYGAGTTFTVTLLK